MRGRVLIIAGSDSGGGAGLQADLKTVTMLGAYGMTAVTALTAQDTTGVHRVMPVDPTFVEEQIRLALSDIGADSVKTGMLVDETITKIVASTLQRFAPSAQLVVDPVMNAKGGATLFDQNARAALIEDLLPHATLFTPNLDEAEALTGIRAKSAGDLEPIADRLIELGARAVLVKGGHLESDALVDLLKTDRGEVSRFFATRIETRATHGTGCTFASAIAAGLAQGMSLVDAVGRAHQFVQRAIRTAPNLGRGHGPLNHAHPLDDANEELQRKLSSSLDANVARDREATEANAIDVKGDQSK